LQRALSRQNGTANVEELVDPDLRACSHEVRARKPSERLFRHVLPVLAERDIAPERVLHIGSRAALDIAPARRLGMRTGLFAGDKVSLQATREQMKESATRPDVLLTELGQIAKVVG
jgi:FMN phosphatase YigB (HAD superfamily)